MGRFINHNDGTITDTQTGLMWEGSCAKSTTWQQACGRAEKLSLGGYTDWRMPTVVELATLVDYKGYNPASAFPRMPSDWFWSSSSLASDHNFAWGVYFGLGYVDYHGKSSAYLARCVRGGPPG